jgi:hypothetical protein
MTYHPEIASVKPTETSPTSLHAEPLPFEITELLEQVRRLPDPYRESLEGSVQRVVEFTHRRRRILNLVQEALGQLRLDMKYLLFDLEATRRERDQYRRNFEGEP